MFNRRFLIIGLVPVVNVGNYPSMGQMIAKSTTLVCCNLWGVQPIHTHNTTLLYPKHITQPKSSWLTCSHLWTVFPLVDVAPACASANFGRTTRNWYAYAMPLHLCWNDAVRQGFRCPRGRLHKHVFLHMIRNAARIENFTRKIRFLVPRYHHTQNRRPRRAVLAPYPKFPSMVTCTPTTVPRSLAEALRVRYRI